MNNLPVPLLIFFGFFYFIGFLCIIKPDIFVNFTIKYFKLSLKLYGLKGDITPTDKANNIAKLWTVFILLIITLLLFSGRF